MNAVSPNLPEINLDLVPAEIRSAVSALLELVKCLLSENRLLRDRLDLLVRRYFGGQKNERISAQQLELMLQGFTRELMATQTSVAKEPAPKDTKSTRSKPVRGGVPDHLPVRSTQTLVPPEVQAQPELFREIDRDTTRILDYEPGRFVCDQIIRPRYVRKDPASAPVAPVTEPEVLAAPLPNRLVEKGLPGVGLLVHLILSRFDDHLPFFRQERIFAERFGVRIPRQTMVGWIEMMAGWFEPILGRMKEAMIATGYLQVDETVIRYLDREEPGKSLTGYFWVYAHPGGDVLFDWRTGRSGESPKEFLAGFQGRLQCDGYGVYPKLAQQLGNTKLFFCVGHFRRKFVEAKDEDRRAAWFLLQLRHLYEIERRLRRQRAGPRLREAVRAAEARPIWERMRKALALWQPRVLPASRLGKALTYGSERWEGLCRYVDHGQVEIDSNIVENAIRPTAVGKKNFLFIGHPDAGGRSAILYSILGSCRSRRINTALYLSDVLTRLPDLKTSDIKDYTPEAWIRRHPEARLPRIA